MKHIKNIAILIALFVVVSCTTDDIVTNEKKHKGSQIQLATRFLPFTEYDVATRATDELWYDFIIFGEDNTCVYYNHCNDGIINIDRSIDFEDIDTELLSECYIYVVVNFPGIYNKIFEELASSGATDITTYIKSNVVGKKNLVYFASVSTPVAPTVNIPESALPRYGVYPSPVNLTQGAEIANGTIYTIDLQSLYSKMVFNIQVDPTEKNPDIYNSNTFQLTGYMVNNLVTEVDFLPGTENEDHDNIQVHDEPIVGILGDDVNQTAATDITFTFYLPERFFQPTTTADNFAYPFGSGNDIREEDKEHRQRYKPLLGKGHDAYNSAYEEVNDKKATYVTISGIFTNHQGHTFDVNYDIYVGNDNYSNFDIVRNRQYNNNITIKGINNSSDQSSDNASISIDHRVNIDRTLPVILSLRRETLLDAHFEVRPLRIKRNQNHSGEETHVKVEVIYENDETYPNGEGNWIGLERSFGDGTLDAEDNGLYCEGDGSSAGKRKYFTYDLVNASLSKDNSATDESRPLHTSTNILLPIANNMQECVWIYVDECTMASPDKDAKRKATIRVTCGKVENNGNFTPIGESLDYVISQHYLFECTYKDRTYHIEHEEEYLHNFDAEDDYEDNQTQEEGMVWGLYNAQLSFDNKALFFDTGTGLFAGIIEWIINDFAVGGNASVFYDFYVPKHDNLENGIPDDATKRAYRGWDFCNEIIKDINDADKKTYYDGAIGKLEMDKTPTSAIEYAYNRNKRNNDGTIPDDYNKWYVPAIDEMEDIIIAGSSYFYEFRNNLYWSCQPSYVVNYATYNTNTTGSYYADDRGVYYIEEENNPTRLNNGYARSTKAVYKGDDGDNDTFDWVYAPSGTQGYDDAMKITRSILWGNTSITMQRSGEYNNKSLNSIDRDDEPENEGNHTRDTKHRVRCVYKSNYYDTNQNSEDY